MRYHLEADLICYCHNHTVDDIRADFLNHGRSTILEDIKRQKKDGSCRCEEKNPRRR